MDSYLTLSGFASDEFTEKRSRFIGYAAPVTTKEEAVDFINSIRSKHWDAKHNVYAYVLREEKQHRYSDDGEPQGTAGMPVLDVIRKEGLEDCVVVVTRYFGGILLGGGGLVRAYTHAASLAVKAAGICRCRLCALAVCRCDYAFYGRLPALIAEFDGEVSSTDFGTDVTLTFSIPKESCDAFCKKLTDLSNGRFSAEFTGEKYMMT